MFILFIFCECLLVVHLLASLVNSIHRNLLCQVAKLLGIVQHTVTVVGRLVVGLVVATVVCGLVVGRLVVALIVAAVIGGLVVTPGSHAIVVTGIFEGVVQRRRSVEIIISLVGVCLIIHLVY